MVIRFTHFFDLIFTIIGWIILFFGGFGLFFLVAIPLESIWNAITPRSGGFKSFIDFVAGLSLYIGVMYLLVRYIIMPLKPIPTYLYINMYLNVGGTWDDAKTTDFLFSGMDDGRWYPMEFLLNIPDDMRREVLLEFAAKISGRDFMHNSKYKGPGQTNQTTGHDDHDSKNKSSGNAHGQDNSEGKNKISPEIIKAMDILSVNKNSTTEEIRNRFRTLIKKYHPDIYAREKPELISFANAKTNELTNAYNLLIKYKEGIS